MSEPIQELSNQIADLCALQLARNSLTYDQIAWVLLQTIAKCIVFKAEQVKDRTSTPEQLVDLSLSSIRAELIAAVKESLA